VQHIDRSECVTNSEHFTKLKSRQLQTLANHQIKFSPIANFLANRQILVSTNLIDIRYFKGEHFADFEVLGTNFITKTAIYIVIYIVM